MYPIVKSPKADHRMRLFAGIMIAGLLLLAGKLWHLQVVSFKKYEHFRNVQSKRTLRLPAIRGKIFDRKKRLLADNQPNYKVALYLEELRPFFQSNFRILHRQHRGLSSSQRAELERLSRYLVVSNLCSSVASIIDRPMKLERRHFEQHYDQKRFVPFSVADDLTHQEKAKFLAKGSFIPGVGLEIQSLRHYPQGKLAAHLLGYVRKIKPSQEKAKHEFSYHQTDYIGKKGIEQIYDSVLRGEAGEKSILINNLMFRQGEDVLFEPTPGDHLYLTLDLDIQRIAEDALAESDSGKRTMGAVVVMNVFNGDVLAMASSPSYDPNEFMERLSPSRWKELNDPTLRPLINRAAFGAYAPGSIFKIIVGLAFLEEGGVNPQSIYHSPGYTMLGRRRIKDTAGAGMFDFYRALSKSSNPYFIHHGMEIGVESLIDWGHRFFLGEKTGLLPGQERAGDYPSMDEVRRKWQAGETANLCIGQGAISVTPLQMAVMISAVANGGTVFRPRIASHQKGQGSNLGKDHIYLNGEVRGRLGTSKEVISILHTAMSSELKDDLGRSFFIGGKTGTAETHKKIRGRRIKDTWFVSFAPIEKPQYSVVVLIVDGDSGSKSCVPIAQKIYKQLRKENLFESSLMADMKIDGMLLSNSN